MDINLNLLNTIKERSHTGGNVSSEWQDYVRKFEQRLNADRIKGGYRPLSSSRVAMLIAPFKKDIYFFLKKCEESQNFSKTFWWHVKPRT
jgi:hypothetical protein